MASSIRYIFRSDAALITLNNRAKADPQKIGEALAKIAKDNQGAIKPQDVVEAAKAASNPLHKHFEWSNTKAAEQYRLDQARHLLRAVDIVDDTKGADRNIRAFISVPTTKETGPISYRTVQAVMKSLDLQQAILIQAEKDLSAFLARYAELKDICDIVEKGREQIRRNLQKFNKESAVA